MDRFCKVIALGFKYGAQDEARKSLLSRHKWKEQLNKTNT